MIKTPPEAHWMLLLVVDGMPIKPTMSNVQSMAKRPQRYMGRRPTRGVTNQDRMVPNIETAFIPRPKENAVCALGKCKSGVR